MLHAWSPISRGVPGYWLSYLGRCHPSLSGFMEHIGCSDRELHADWASDAIDRITSTRWMHLQITLFFFLTFKRFLVSWSAVKQKSYRPSRLLRRQNTILYISSLGFVASYHGFPCFFFTLTIHDLFPIFPFLFFSLRLFAFTFSCRFCPTVIDFRHHFYSSSMPGFPQVDMHSWCQYFNILQAHPKGRHRSFPWD